MKNNKINGNKFSFGRIDGLKKDLKSAIQTSDKSVPFAIPRWNKTEHGYLSLKDFSTFTSVLLLLLSDFRTKESSWRVMNSIKILLQKNGPNFTVSYLKECHRLAMKSLSGNPESSTMRVATRRGLPLIIPGHLRLLIERNDIPTIRIVLSMLTVYRIIKCKPVLKLESITAPFTGVAQTLHIAEVRHVLRYIDRKGISLIKNANLLINIKAGPNYKVSSLGAIFDAIAFKEDSTLMEHFKLVCDYTGKSLYSLLLKEQSSIESWKRNLEKCRSHKIRSFVQAVLEHPILGRLHQKLEAAGKVRIFAITDIWTQSALRPLNDYLFAVLKRIPQDGTFNQLAPIHALKQLGCQEVYSYDLSAATDRLPVDLQCQVLSQWFTTEFALAWKGLLTSRSWYLEGVPYRYSVGQPMGALSSWAMLALTHHVIVQIAAMRVGWTRWFNLYAVLGDDIVIADKAVAKVYLSIMSFLGVDINMSKSLESQIGLAEFAKRLIGNDGDISPFPPKIGLNLIYRPKGLIEAVRDLVSRGALIQTMDLKRFVAKLPGAHKFRKDFIWNLVGPIGFLNLMGLSPFLGNRSLTQEQLKLVAQAADNVVNGCLISAYYRAIELQSKYWERITDKLGNIDAPIPWSKAAKFPSPDWYPEPGVLWSNPPKPKDPSVTLFPWSENPANPKNSGKSEMDFFGFGEKKPASKPNFFAEDYWFGKATSKPKLDIKITVFKEEHFYNFMSGLPSTDAILLEQDRQLSQAQSDLPSLLDHNLTLAPLSYTGETVYQYLVDAFSRVDGPNLGTPDLLSPFESTPKSFSDRVKLYYKLEQELERIGIASVLDIHRLPKDPGSDSLNQEKTGGLVA